MIWARETPFASRRIFNQAVAPMPAGIDESMDPMVRVACEEEANAAVYQLLGAIKYYAVSESTVREIFGDQSYANLDKMFYRQLDQLIKQVATRSLS